MSEQPVLVLLGSGQQIQLSAKGRRRCYAFTGDARYHSIFGSTRVGRTPCSAECPTNVDIPSYMSLIREGNLAEAARILLEANPLPAITGRVCPHFCESKCNRDGYDEAVSVRCIERFLGDYILENPNVMGKLPQTKTKKTGRHYRFRSGRSFRRLLSPQARLQCNHL